METDTIELNIMPLTPIGKGTKKITCKTPKSETAQEESQGDSTFPTDGIQAVLNKTKIKKSKTNRKRTKITIRMNPRPRDS